MTPQQQAEETRDRVRVIYADAQRKGIRPTVNYIAAQAGIGRATANRYLAEIRR